MSEAGVWDRLAGRYDLIVRLFDTSYAEVAARVRRDLPPGGRVLEVAAGTGQFTAAIAAVSSEVVATDVSPRMVDALRRTVATAALGNVECRVMSATAIDAPDATFDAVFCANALHVMREPERALAEFRRVIRPDGVLIVPTFLHGVDAVRRGLSHGLGLVSPFVAHTRFDLPGLESTVAGAGFEVRRAERMPGLFPMGYVVARRPLAAG